MQIWEFLVVSAGGVVAGFAAGYFIVQAGVRARQASTEAQFEAARVELTSITNERDQLRASLSESERQSASRGATVTALESRLNDAGRRHQITEDQCVQLRTQVTSLTSDLRSMQTVVKEREENLREVRATLEQSKQTLAEAFKATGAEVLRQMSDDLMGRAKTQFEGQRQLGDQSLEERKRAIEELLKPIRDELAKQEHLVKELSEKREGDAKTFESRLMQIAELQQKASAAAQTLSSALRDNRQRGRWGEVSLKNVVELSGMTDNVDFYEQSTVTDGEGSRLRPDMQIRLPGGQMIPVDSKVPMDAYLDSLNQELPESERVARRSAHAKALKGHVRTLASKDYAQALGGDVELTVLFVPFESGLIAALEEDGTIFQDALEKKVIITTASTLLALLRTCSMQWQQAKLNENARRIGEEAKELLKRINTFTGHFHKVGEKLEGAANAYNDAVASFNSRLLSTATRAAELAGAMEQVPDDVSPVNATLREVRRPALESKLQE